MKKIVVFAGTTEGRRLSEKLSLFHVPHSVCVATEYGNQLLRESAFATVYEGRMDEQEIHTFLLQQGIEIVVDATHPYATLVTENIKAAIAGSGCQYLRLLRKETDQTKENGEVRFFESHRECIRALLQESGNILLTTGSNHLFEYLEEEELKSRIYARVLPGLASIELCEKGGLLGKQILAMQGPFSCELNLAMIHQFSIRHLVTKKSGLAGGFLEKAEAARQAGIPLYVIGQREQEEGCSFEEVCQRLEEELGTLLPHKPKIRIQLVGAGMGGKETLTIEALLAIQKADILLGAKRLTEQYAGEACGRRLSVKSYYRKEELVPYLQECMTSYAYLDELRVTILFSGDSGFYSGCQKLFLALLEWKEEQGIDAEISVLPGISSVSAFAALLSETWQDAAIISTHGVEEKEWALPLLSTVRQQEKTYVLVSGKQDVLKILSYLRTWELSECEVLVGYELTSERQRIFKLLAPFPVSVDLEEGLYILLIQNQRAQKKRRVPGIRDEELIRGKVPMTKEEIREVILCKLSLKEGDLLYDIGSGTGSIAIEAAELYPENQVYAIEKKKEAVLLIAENKKKFHAENVELIEGEAPEAFGDLPKPTHAFIGGSSGRLKEILQALYQKNHTMKVVISAISLETIAELTKLSSQLPICQEELLQLQVSHAREVGAHHLLTAQNPIVLSSFVFCEGKEQSGI